MVDFIWKKHPNDLSECYNIRKKVFVCEQGFSAENEIDETDKTAYHLLLKYNGLPVGTLRIFLDNGGYHIGRFCVLKEYRKYGFGRQLLCEAEKKIKSKGKSCAVLSAQVSASGFYEKCGYIKEGEEYLDEFCPHIKMTKHI